MKITFLSTLLFIFSFTALFAQIPENPEDVSPLKIGEKIPIIEITSIENEQVLLIDIVKEKISILLFYRGGWCPYCNKHLSAVGELKDEINELGYQIIGLSPDAPEQLKKSIDKNELNYSLYSDNHGKLITAMGIAFQAPDGYKDLLLKYSDDGNTGFLPVPSIFVLATDGTILYEYVNANYKERISSEKLLEVLKELK